MSFIISTAQATINSSKKNIFFVTDQSENSEFKVAILKLYWMLNGNEGPYLDLIKCDRCVVVIVQSGILNSNYQYENYIES